ncbi:cadherin-like domain-containing protein [Aeromicrobium senzhongii]|uniref:Cadherin-like domain-containing protein n=1 Tax=Aeromicrobium senzhongii TaxID=2663859 RepID=A0ABX6STB3_9ACTN|nr:DUF6801 domain-containing protein [Aeromicrobium senzhongii]MTB88397.1 hypothetical protein [Aeromicrobium senzhongii]QNL94634.1 cadherin-like domain-containing protein [Aeromicrobium senzhongii]
MTRSSLVARRVALPITAALVGGTFATVGLASPANAADVALTKDFVYDCNVVAGGLNLRQHNIGVSISTKVPTTVYPGQTIPARAVKITLTMPEKLREATVDVIGGTAASGSSTDAALVLTTAGKSMNVRIPRLAAPNTAIPQVANVPWTIPASGTVPAIKAPAYTAGSVALGMPARFTISATLQVADGTAPSTLTCVGPADRALGSIRAVKAPNVAPKAPRTVKVVTKKNKAKNFVIRAKDANGDRLTYKVGKVKKKAGKVSGKGPKFKFKPKKNFKGKTAFYVSVRDGKGGSARVKVIVTVKKK